MEYSIFDVNKVKQDIDIHVHTSYICYEGIYYNDKSTVGLININDISPVIVTVCHKRIRLAKIQSLFTMQGCINRLNSEFETNFLAES